MSSRGLQILRVIAAAVVCMHPTAFAAQSAKVDVTGTWAFTIQSDAGTGTPTVTFKQDSEKLTGHYSSMLMGEAELTGSLKGQTIDFTVRADVQGMPVEFKFNGTVENRDSMKGTLADVGFGAATFTAKRK